MDLALQAGVSRFGGARQITESVGLGMGEAAGVGGGFGGFEDDAVRRAHGEREGGGPTCGFVEVDVLKVREVGGPHEVGEGGRMEAGRLARL